MLFDVSFYHGSNLITSYGVLSLDVKDVLNNLYNSDIFSDQHFTYDSIRIKPIKKYDLDRYQRSI